MTTNEGESLFISMRKVYVYVYAKLFYNQACSRP